jgi:hypothetical protein
VPRSPSPGRRIASARAHQRPIARMENGPWLATDCWVRVAVFLVGRAQRDKGAANHLPRTRLIISTAWRLRLLLGPRGEAFVMNLSHNEQASVWIHQDRVSVIDEATDSDQRIAESGRALPNNRPCRL